LGFSLHRVNQGLEGRVDTWIGPSQPTPQGSVDVSGFSSDKWYHIKAEAQGNNLRAKYWEKGTVEPVNWHIDYTDPEPLGGGFFGVIHTDAHQGNSVHWDSFAVGPQPQDSTDFSEYDSGARTPFDWRALGFGGDKWSVEEHQAPSVGHYLKHHYSGQEADHARVSILRWDNDIGKVEAGKRYLMKIVVADTTDGRWDSAVFLESGGIRVVPVLTE